MEWGTLSLHVEDDKRIKDESFPSKKLKTIGDVLHYGKIYIGGSPTSHETLTIKCSEVSIKITN